MAVSIDAGARTFTQDATETKDARLLIGSEEVSSATLWVGNGCAQLFAVNPCLS